MKLSISRPVLGAIAAASAVLASAPALAVAVDATNTRPVSIGTSPATEQTLQQVLDYIFFGPNVNAATDQVTDGMYASAAAPASTVPTMVVEFTSNFENQKFGIWFGTDTANILTIDLLLGPASGTSVLDPVNGVGFPSAATIQFSGNQMLVFGADCGAVDPTVNCGLFTDARITNTAFGFYLDLGNGTKYYTADQLNGGAARALVYEYGGNWAFGFEDGSDNDYQDLVVKVESLKRVPEPGSLALMGLGLLGLGLARRRKI